MAVEPEVGRLGATVKRRNTPQARRRRSGASDENWHAPGDRRSGPSIETRLKGLEERIAKLEERIPEKPTLDKLASVSDAILATRTEANARGIADLRMHALTKWDVALVILLILGVIVAIVSVTVDILRG